METINSFNLSSRILSRTFDNMLARAMGLYVSKLPTFPALSLLTGTNRTDNTESGNNPCIKRLVKQIARRGYNLILAYLRCSAQMFYKPVALLSGNFFIVWHTSCDRIIIESFLSIVSTLKTSLCT